MTDVFVLGGYQTDFAINWTRAGGDFASLMRACLENTFDAVAFAPERIETVHVGNFIAELTHGQGHLGGLAAEVFPAFRGLPISRHEAACASGSMALNAAMADIESGRYDASLVLGIELMRNVDGETAADHLGAAAWRGREAQDARYVWPYLFSELMEEYDRRHGLNYAHLGRIAALNLENARRNPNAQTREWTVDPSCFEPNDGSNPVVEGRLRRYDCARITDGAAAVILAGEESASRYARATNRSLDDIPRIKGWGHTTARLSYQGKIDDHRQSPLIFPHVRQAVEDAFRRAGLAGVRDISCIETHDCFTITEYMAVDHFGITPPGMAGWAVEDGRIEIGGAIPINPSGGLIGAGHPVGATGVRMMLDAWKQVTDNAGDYQVEGARNVATLNIGGSTTTTAVFVVGT